MRNFLLTSFLLLVLSSASWAQDRTITGKVTSDDGNTLPGVNVLQKGTANGTVTDSDGKYTISIPSTGVTLVFSFIGMKTTEVAVGERTVVDVQLGLDITQLAEIVVTGTGVATDKRNVAISVESITAGKLPQTPTASIDQALVGKIPGAQISSVDGTPGAGTNILLRGINSIQGGTQPMILLDGIQVRATDLNSLDMSNIERVEVVQGAASATIYGAQGANGVIQLFSKRGKGKVSINVSSSYGVSSYINSGNLAKASLHGFATDAANNVVGSGGVLALEQDGTYTNNSPVWQRTITDPSIIVNKPYNQNLKYYDHFAQFFKEARSTINSINISGGSEATDYAVSLSNTRQESTVKNNGTFERTNLGINVGTELFKGFKLRSTTQIIYTDNSLNPFFRTGGGQGFIGPTGGGGGIYGMMNASPFYDFEHKNSDGNYPFYLGTQTVGVNGFNPNAYFQYSSGDDKKIDVIQNLQATYTINKFLELDAKYGLNVQQQNVKFTIGNQILTDNLNYTSQGAQIYINNAADATGEVDKFFYTTTFQNLLTTAIIKTDFKKDFNIDFPLKTSTQISYDYRNNVFDQTFTYGYSLKTATLNNQQQVASTQVLADSRTPFVTFGYLVNQKFEFGDFGGVSAGFRRDWSSAFGSGITPATFPRVDGFLRLASFNFWKNSSLSGVIPELKIRSAYGQAGIQPGPFNRYSTFSGTNLGTGIAYFLASQQNNPNLKVERTDEFEIGTDLTVNLLKGVWLSGFTSSFTVWNRKSSDVIYATDAATSTGYTAQLNNAFTLESNGIQFGINLDVYTSDSFNWDFTANFGKQKSIIADIAGTNTIVLGATAGSTALALNKGDKIGQIYGFKTLHSVDDLRPDGTRYIQPADATKYAVSSDGYLVNATTKRIQFGDVTTAFGDPNPNFNASFINNFTYKKFLTAAFQFDWINGSHIYNQTKEWMYRDAIHADYQRPVTINGETAAFGGYYQSAYSDVIGSINGARNGTKDYFYEDASFVRLRNVSVGFDLTQAFSIKGFKKLQLVFTGRNLLTWTKYTGFDPEINSVFGVANQGNNTANNSSLERGIDHNSTPNNKTYQISLNLGF
jgi:TonB-dependent starch-binding outer membrane protein SusC